MAIAVIIKEAQVYGNINNQNTNNNSKTTNIANNITGNITSNEKQVNSNISQNVNLKELHLNIQGISPSFNKDITEYYLVISDFINDIDVEAIAEESTSNVSITGNKNLQMGSNKIEIKVTSGDEKNSKLYVINVSKMKDENLGNCFLENLAIENVNIVPEFNSEIFSYYAEVESNIENLNILAVPQNEKAKVEVNGEKNLQFGDNTVEILVTAEDGITIKKYNIQIHKKLQDEENLEKENIDFLEKTEKDLRKHEKKFYWWILIVVLLVLLIGIICFILWKRGKNNL